MRAFPGRLTAASITAMTENELLTAEFESHVRFLELEAVEKREKGRKYNLMRASEELMNAWDQWWRLVRATQTRSLTPKRLPKSGIGRDAVPVS